MTKFDSIVDAVVLSANDVIADIMIVNFDEEGFAPVQLAQVTLPTKVRYARKKAGDKSVFRRGDFIQISCSISCHKKQALTEKHLGGIEDIFLDQFDEDESSKIAKILETKKQFANQWNFIEKEGRCLK